MSNNRKVLVVGASGYIGMPLLNRAKLSHEVCGTSSIGTSVLFPLRLDTPSDFDYGLIRASDVVFLTAAISAPDICAREHARAWAVNVSGTTEFISAVIARGGRVVFFSSDTVYGERNESFDESAENNPAGEYAEMKCEVENRFLGNTLFKAIRLSYVFSKEDKFTKYLSGCAKRGEEAELFHPFCRTIIHRDDVVDGVLALAQRWDEFPQPIINFGGPDVLDRMAFAKILRDGALPDLRFRVTEPGDEFFKNRPRVIAMLSNVLPRLLGRSSRRLLEAVHIEFASS